MANELFHDIEIPEKKKMPICFDQVVVQCGSRKQSKKKKNQKPRCEVSPNSALN